MPTQLDYQSVLCGADVNKGTMAMLCVELPSLLPNLW